MGNIRRKTKSQNSCDNPNRKLPQGMKPGHFRSPGKIRLLKLYRTKPDLAKMKERPTEPARIQPDRRWFNNTRVITQTRLEQLREAVEAERKDPYLVQLRSTKLPVSLFNEAEAKYKRPRSSTLLSLEPFESTFGKKKSRKRAKLECDNLESFAERAQQNSAAYSSKLAPSVEEPSESDTVLQDYTPANDEPPEALFKKGQSKRIWGELYKVIDSSDVIVEVLDARDPQGTRCTHLENYIKKEKPNKKVILLLNKCDLIPSWAAARWTKVLSAQAPTVAFHSSITNPFGKMTLISLLRQFAALMKERKHVSVGFIGYPNVGKSSVINTLRRKAVCKAAPIPGETKVWQYVALTSRVYLIDCPGIVPADSGGTTAKVLKGVVRAEKVQDPDFYIQAVLDRCKKEDIQKRYKLNADWDTADEFLSALGLKLGKLCKGGDPDRVQTAKIVLLDLQRGKLPFFIPPPFGAPAS